MAQARRDREARRAEDQCRREQAASGSRHPSADELLRGHPLQGRDIGVDIQEFVRTALPRTGDVDATQSLRRIALAAARPGLGGGPDGEGILAALLECRLSPEADPDGSLRLRCVIYAALLGDMDAAHAVAAEAALAAYVQDWHIEGDGSDLVWQAAGWSAYASSRAGPFRQLPYPITEMDCPRARVDAFADELRLRVARVLSEVG